MNENNSTTNAILVILVVIVVGFIVWFVMARSGSAPAPSSIDQYSSTTSTEINNNIGTSTGTVPVGY